MNHAVGKGTFIYAGSESSLVQLIL